MTAFGFGELGLWCKLLRCTIYFLSQNTQKRLILDVRKILPRLEIRTILGNKKTQIHVRPLEQWEDDHRAVITRIKIKLQIELGE